MGGSSARPADLAYKKKKEALRRKREELLLYIETYIWHLKRCYENIPNKWYVKEIYDYLDKIEEKSKGLKIRPTLMGYTTLLRGNIYTRRAEIILDKMLKEIEKAG